MIIFTNFIKLCLGSESFKVAVFDAGSSGTRLKTFVFDNNILLEEKSFKTDDMQDSLKKGIHELSEDEIDLTIKHLLNISGIDKKTPVGFYGTAGLRSISDESQLRILNSVKNTTKDYHLVESKVLTGVEEALYALKGYEFLKSTKLHYSLIDMGGKSVQIVERSNDKFSLVSLDLGISNSKCENDLNVKSENIKEVSFLINESLSCLDNFISGFFCQKENFYENLNNNKIKNLLTDNKFDHNENDVSLTLKNINNECIDKFFDEKLKYKLKEKNEILLMSYYEELLNSKKVKNLEDLYKEYKSKCENDQSEECSKMYYAISFLKKIGIDDKTNLNIVNTIKELDISWSLGKALEIKNKVLDLNLNN